MQKYKCLKCGHETENKVAEQQKILYEGLCHQCWLDKDYNNNMNELGTATQYGWVCPVCGRGNSPFTSTCPCQGYPPNKITC